MSELQTCPQCGASNPSSAVWCNQCYARFEPAVTAPAAQVAAPPPPPPPQPTPAPDTPTGTGAPADPAVPDSEGPSWTCRTCDTSNPLVVDRCSVCGKSIYDNYGGDATVRPQIATGKATRWALIPGFGHAKTGNGVHGLTIGLLVAFTLAAGIAFLVSGESVVGGVLVLAALVLWAVSVVDAGQLAQGNTEQILLKPRVLTVAAGIIVTICIVVVMSQGIPQDQP